MIWLPYGKWATYGISGAKRQNTFPLILVKLRNRALKFLVHFSLVCLGKYPKAHEKWSQMEKPIWGSIFHPSGMVWRPFRGRFLQILQPKRVFRSLFPILQACFGGHLGVIFCKFCNQKGFSEAYFSVFPAFMKRQNPFPLQKGGNYNGNGFWRFVP